MPAIGGSIESVTLAGRRFAVAADADSNRKLGNPENATEPNGDGSSRLIKTRVSWMLDSITISIDDSLGDAEYLSDLATLKSYFTCLITYASGISYEGQGQLVDEVQTGSATTTAPIKLSGTGQLTRQ